MYFYNPQTLKEDVFGGVNAAIVALPAALGFGALAGLSPVHGLYGAIFVGLIAAIFGGTKTLISNPTGPMAVVTGEIVISLVQRLGLKDGYEILDFWPYLLLIFVLAGIIQIIFGFLKLGKYVHYIPTPVISGFMSGIGVIIIVSQLKPFLGVVSAERGSLDILLNLPKYIMSANPISVIIALSTMAIIYFFPRITKAIPSPLVAIVGVTGVTAFIGLDASYLIPTIPQAFPDITAQFAVFGNLGDLFAGDKKDLIGFIAMSGVYLAAIGMIDALLTAVVADQLTKEKHDSDKELFGQGLGNIVAAMFGGMMGAGTTPATVLNINSGARNRISGIIHALVLILILLVAAPAASLIPKAALAGLLLRVGISILDFEVFRVIRHIPKLDNFVMFVVLTLTAFWDLMYAVAAGLVMASLIFMKKMADVVEGESSGTKFDRLVNQLIDTFDDPVKFRKDVVVKNLRGPMFFGFASRFQDSVDEIPDVKAVVINFGGVNYIDQSGVYTLKEAITRLVDRGINVCLSELHDYDSKLIAGMGITPHLVDDHHVFSSVEESVMWLNEPGHLDNIFTADDELYIPSAYTPNGDGINDEWELKNIDKYPNCMVRITTREGREIFASEGYRVMWEGFREDGSSLPNDKYLYSIDLYGDGKEVREGKVTIFR